MLAVSAEGAQTSNYHIHYIRKILLKAMNRRRGKKIESEDSIEEAIQTEITIDMIND